MRIQMDRQSALLVAFVCVLSVVPALAQTRWHITNTLPIGGEGGWDYITVDAVHHRLFVPRQTHTMVLDENSGSLLADIPGQETAHGVALVPSVGRGFITDGGGKGAILIFDLKTYVVLGKLTALPDADGIIYDAKLNKVLAVSGDKGVLMTFSPDIDAQHGKIDTPIPLGGAPEFLASDGTGKVYVNLEDKDAVAVVDLNSRQVVARWPVAPGGRPVGMAIDTRTHHLLIGGRKPQKLVVMSTEDGRVLSALPIGAGVDATGFAADEAFASCADGTLTVLKGDGIKYSVSQVLQTRQGARTMGIDSNTHTLYLPTSDFEPQIAGAAGRPRVKPGTFMIVVVSR